MAGDTSPTSRALRTLELLQGRPGISAEALARALDITDRSARRYIAILREAGIPVESTRGRDGGYRLGRGLRLPPLLFTATEALGLVMAVLDGDHAAADPADPVGAALTTLIRALPDSIAQPARTMRAHALAAPDRDAARPDPATTSALVGAVASRRTVRLSYRSGTGADSEFAVDPWAVVVRHGRWYLLCANHRSGVRTYRIDRIRGLDVLDGTFRPPPDLDPVATLEEHLGIGWPYDAEVVFDVPYDVAVGHVRPPMGRLEPLEGGRCCRLVGSTNNPGMYAAEWLAAIPLPFRVTGGPELRAAVDEVARRMTAAVDESRPGQQS